MSMKNLTADDFSTVVKRKTNKGGGVSIPIKKPFDKPRTKPNLRDIGFVDDSSYGGEPPTEPELNTGYVSTYTGESVSATGGTGDAGEKGAVKKPYDISEFNKYLYDSKLENIFKDYQENIATLTASEQQNLEDAYYIREMSKKYLGEYASNVGIGDVSGNLLDIYGNYQKNKADITANYDMLELNLTKEYRAEKTAIFNEKMKEQYDMELADFEEGSQEIMFNAVTGNYDTELYADEWEYLDAMKESGDLSTKDYQVAYGTMYSSMLERIQTNIENENYEGSANAEEYINSFSKLIAGDKSMLQGISKQIDKQKQRLDIINNLNTRNYGEGVEGLDYLESVRGIIGEDAYQQHYINIYADLREEAFNGKEFDPEIMTIDEYVQGYVDRGLSTTDAKDLREGLASFVEQYEASKIDTSIGNEKSENYIGADYNFHVNTGGENVGAGSYMYQDAYGKKTFAVLDDSEADGEVSGWYASHEDLMEAFKDENDGANPKTGQEVEFSAYNEETEETQTFSYVFERGRWYRLVQEDLILEPEMMQWKDTNLTSKDYLFLNKGLFPYKGKKYVQGEEYTGIPDGVDAVAGADSLGNDNYSNLKKLFNKVHGSASTGNAVVYYNNNFYIRKTDGKIYIMNEEK